MNQLEQLKREGNLLKRNPKGPTPKKPLQRNSRVKRVSSRRAKELREYAVKRKEFLRRHPYCQWWMKHAGVRLSDIDSEGCILDGGYMFVPLATDIHHVAGRIGDKLLDEKDWRAVSRNAHVHIHAHPIEARALGFLK